MAGDAVDFGPSVPWPTDAGKPSCTAPQDRWHDRDRLDIVDGCRAAIKTDLRGKRRLEPGLALAAFQALEQPGLLAADIGAGSPMQVKVEVPAGAAGILANEAGLVSFVDGGLPAPGSAAIGTAPRR